MGEAGDMTETALAPVPMTAEAQQAILRYLKMDPNAVATQALLLICDRYGLDPLLKHVVLIDGRPYVTRDGLLHVAHRDGRLDGIEVLVQDETDKHFIAKVAVYRRDMSHPFSYVGRYPKSANNAGKYGPEMAVKCAEVMALRRAFDVSLAAREEMWDEQASDGGKSLSPSDDDSGAAPSSPDPAEDQASSAETSTATASGLDGAVDGGAVEAGEGDEVNNTGEGATASDPASTDARKIEAAWSDLHKLYGVTAKCVGQINTATGAHWKPREAAEIPLESLQITIATALEGGAA